MVSIAKERKVLNITKKQKIVTGALLFLGIYAYMTYGTDIFRYYQNSSRANEPTLKLGSRMLVSSLIKPKRLDFVSFEFDHPKFGKGKNIFRLIGTPSDTLKIKKGNVIINGNNIDSLLNLAHAHKISLKLAKKIKKELITITYDGLPLYNSTNDSVIVFLSRSTAKKYNLLGSRIIDEPDHVDDHIYSIYNKKWNKDYFGPLILKENEYFVMGDNRDNSEDSRFIGLIDKSQVIGKAIKFF